MRLYTWLVANALFPLHERFKRHGTVAHLRRLEKSQWLPPAELEAERIQRLKGFLREIRTKVPYYADKLSAVDIDSIDSVSDLGSVPFLTKTIIRKASDDLRSKTAVGLQHFNTGGSTGSPLVFCLGRRRISHDVAAKWRATRWWDVDLGDPEIVIWGSPIELGAQDFVRVLRDRVFRTRLLSAFEMSEHKMAEYLNVIVATRPRSVFGYPSSIHQLTDFSRSRGTRLNDLGTKVVFVTAERLYDHQREGIEAAFGCPVANGYGAREAGFIAHECPSGGMHISAEDIIVEIIGPDGEILPEGESGEIVVTHMATAEFPFVRYRTGDIASLSSEPCVCGRGLPLLVDLQGRSTDFVVTADGARMHGLALIYILRDIPEIEEFNIIQENLLLTRVLIVTNGGLGQHRIDDIISGFRERLGEDVMVDLQFVDNIPPTRSGKHRYVTSKVLSQHGV